MGSGTKDTFKSIASYFRQPAMNKISIAVIGLGGTGQMICNHLSRIALAMHRLYNITLCVDLVDFDTISDTNVVRQGFPVWTVSESKAAYTATMYNRTYGFTWGSYAMPALDYLGSGKTPNILIMAIDSMEARYDVVKLIDEMDAFNPYNSDDYHLRNLLLYMDAGNSSNTFRVSVTSYNNALKDTDSGKCDSRKPLKQTPSFLQGYTRERCKEIDKENEKKGCSLLDSLNSQNLNINSLCAQLTGSYLWEYLTTPIEIIDSVGRGFFGNCVDFNIKRVKLFG